MNSFRELRVWQAGMDLVEKIYLITQTFPASELYGLTSQMRRAAVSIPSNIAEGHTRKHIKEYLHHLSIAQASLAELETQVEIAMRLKYLLANEAKEIVTVQAVCPKRGAGVFIPRRGRRGVPYQSSLFLPLLGGGWGVG